MKWTLMILLLSLSSACGPPLPGCSVTAEVGGTVILPVKVHLPQDSEMLQPIISWVKESGGIVHDYWYNKDYNEHQVDHFKGRTSLFKEEIKKGNVSLKISNVTKRDEGIYTCEVVHEDTKNYKVSLCVTEKREDSTKSPKPEKPDETSVGIVGIVIGVLVLAALIGVTVFLYRRHKGTERRYHDAETDNRAMETLRGGGEHVYSSEDKTAICAQQQNEGYTNNELLDCA